MCDRDGPELVARLRRGDEHAFAALIDRHDAALRRTALVFVSTAASADDVVQDTWLAVLAGLAAFEGRSSIKTWIFRILINRAKTRSAREARTIPVSGLDDDGAPAAAPGRCDEHGRAQVSPERWNADTPKHRLLRKELAAAIESAMRCLPERQRAVVVLRDALGWSADEVCDVLDLHQTNQRVLLHRARARLRAILWPYQGNGRDVVLSHDRRASERLARRRADAG